MGPYRTDGEKPSMDPRLQKIIQDGQIAYMAGKEKDDQELKNWVDGALLADIKDLANRGYSSRVIKSSSLPFSMLNHKRSDERIRFVRDYIAATIPGLSIESHNDQYRKSDLEWFVVGW